MLRHSCRYCATSHVCMTSQGNFGDAVLCDSFILGGFVTRKQEAIHLMEKDYTK